ncbi:unnamed protein product [Absidia cylindrospora]
MEQCASFINNGNIENMEQNNFGVGANDNKGKKRLDSDLDNIDNDDDINEYCSGNGKNDDIDVFFTDRNLLRLKKRAKTYSYLTPRQYMTSPHKPQLNEDDLDFEIILSEHHAARSASSSSKKDFSRQCRTATSEPMMAFYPIPVPSHPKLRYPIPSHPTVPTAILDQNESLKSAPGTFSFLKSTLEQKLDDIPRYLWTNGYASCSVDELNNNDMIRHILTDFRVNCLIASNNNIATNERTPFAEQLIPIFNAFAGITGLMNFTWCDCQWNAVTLCTTIIATWIIIRWYWNFDQG